MAVLKYIESPRKDLGSIVIDSGLVINCNDSIEIFFDMTDEIRMQTEKIVILQLTQERFSLQQSNTASNAKLYYVKENESFYIYGNDGWTVVITTNEIGHIIGNPKNIVPTSITRGDTTYAPLTLATQVFTDDGETVESKLDQIGQLSSSFDSILVTEASASFDIPVPYDEFFSYPNAMTVYIGTVQVYPSRYSVEGNRITFQEPVDANRTINFNFLFNSKIPTMGVMKYIDGAYIARGTIPIDRMAKYSNDIYTNDTTSVATSAAVRKLFDTLTPLIDGAGIIKRCVTTNTSVNLHSNLTEEYKLLDGNVLLCKFHTDVADNATLLVAGTAYPIYNLDGNPIKQGQINQNDELFIQYNDSNKRFYVTNGLPYGIQTRSAVEIATEGQTEFSYANVAYNRGTDYMAVFQNSVKLIEKEHFTFDCKNKRINLVGYTAEEGDVFEFVVLYIARSRSLDDGVMVGLTNAEEALLEKFNDYATKTGTGASGTWGINITGNATYADKLDGYHEYNFLRYRGNAAQTGEDTLWNQIGIKEYRAALPQGVSDTYNYGAVVSLPSSSFRLDIWYNDYSSTSIGTGLLYRSGYLDEKRSWARLLDTVNYNNYAPTKTGTGASGTWDINISGTATKATQDGNGANIADTYLKKAGDTVTGTLNVPTQVITDNSTKVANTAFVQSTVDSKVSQLVNSAPETLATLNGLSNALGNDPNFATTVANMIGQKADKTSVDNKIARHNTDGTAHEDIRQMFNNYLTREETAKEIESAESAATRASERFYQSMRYDIVGPTPEYITVANFIVGAGPAAIASS